MEVVQLHLHVTQQIHLFREELVADGAAEQLHPFVGNDWCVVRGRQFVLVTAGLAAVDRVPDRFVALLRRLLRVREIGQRSSSGEDSPVVGVVFLDVVEESNFVGTVFLAHLTGEVVRSGEV